jgi:uncharacterized membrane protein YdjX (TVP38/TMEM64 family)
MGVKIDGGRLLLLLMIIITIITVIVILPIIITIGMKGKLFGVKEIPIWVS